MIFTGTTRERHRRYDYIEALPSIHRYCWNCETMIQLKVWALERTFQKLDQAEIVWMIDSVNAASSTEQLSENYSSLRRKTSDCSIQQKLI